MRTMQCPSCDGTGWVPAPLQANSPVFDMRRAAERYPELSQLLLNAVASIGYHRRKAAIADEATLKARDDLQSVKGLLKLERSHFIALLARAIRLFRQAKRLSVMPWPSRMHYWGDDSLEDVVQKIAVRSYQEEVGMDERVANAISSVEEFLSEERVLVELQEMTEVMLRHYPKGTSPGQALIGWHLARLTANLRALDNYAECEGGWEKVDDKNLRSFYGMLRAEFRRTAQVLGVTPFSLMAKGSGEVRLLKAPQRVIKEPAARR